MRKIIKNSIQKIGKAPGSLHYTGNHTFSPRLSLVDYTQDSLVEFFIEDLADLNKISSPKTVSWLRLEGLSDLGLSKLIAKEFGLHPLVMEDILHVNQRPKADMIDTGVFITLPLVFLKEGIIESEQVSFVIADYYVLSFHESAEDFFAPIHDRLKDNTTRLRREKSWYLLYSLLDCVIDHYLVVLEKLEKALHDMNQKILAEADYDALPDLYRIKSDLLLFRKLTQPVVDIPTKILAGLSEVEGLQPIYFQDLRDHALQVTDISKSYLDMAESLHNLYFSLVGIRTNQTMQTLTVITLIFMPLTLLTGIYGMNFHYMPELDWRLGYPLLLVLMMIITSGILWFFKRKKWY